MISEEDLAAQDEARDAHARAVNAIGAARRTGSVPNMEAIRAAGGKNAYELPPGVIPADKHYQWIAHTVVGQKEFGQIEEFKKRGWAPVPWLRHADLYDSATGMIIVGGLVLMEKSRESVEETKRDDLIMNLLAAAVSRGALGRNEALFNGNSVKEAFFGIRDAYADKGFREQHRDSIRRRARALAIEANMAPDATVMLEPPLRRDVEEVGIPVWYVSADRLVETWRIFEPMATAELKKTVKEKT